MFEELHFQKIDLCDAIYVVNIDQHIGEGTKRDIDYAISQGKEVLFMNPEINKQR